LDGARGSVFRPSTTDVGYRIRCVVTVPVDGVDDDDDEDDTIDSGDDGGGGAEEKSCLTERRSRPPRPPSQPEVISCELPDDIESDVTLFKAALRTFVRVGGGGDTESASFSNFIVRLDEGGGGGGCGTMTAAERVELRITVSIVEDRENRSQDGFSLSIDRLVDGVPEPIHDYARTPISCVSVSADPSRATFLTLSFPPEVIASAPALSALCSTTDNDNDSSTNSSSSTKSGNVRLDLQAPSRLYRESFMLALGIAMYSGNISGLNTKTVLFRSAPPPTATDPNFKGGEGGSSVEEPDPHRERPPSGSSCSSPRSGTANNRSSIVTDDGSPFDDHRTTASLDPSPSSSQSQPPSNYGVSMRAIESALEQDIVLLRKKLEGKNNAVIDLQHQLHESRGEVKQGRIEYDDCYRSLRLAERRIETLQSDATRTKNDHTQRLAEYETRHRDQGDHDRALRSLTNEKAVLSAAVEARDSKLTRMADLQGEVEVLKREVQNGRLVRNQLGETNTKYRALQDELASVKTSEHELQKRIAAVEQTAQQTTDKLTLEKKTSRRIQKEADTNAQRYLRTKAEKNSVRQKADSLAREMSRICRNGRTLDVVEQILSSHESMTIEVELLRSQKRRALEELEDVRGAYDDSVRARERLGKGKGGKDLVRALEQRVELERVVEDLTEYVGAKEMQIGTMREVNRELNEEIRVLERTRLDRNDV